MIKAKERDAIIQALHAGIVPRIGLQHIVVDRKQEIKALMEDLKRISDGSATFRFVVGDYGAGKTFLLHLVKTYALKQGLVTVHADLTPDRRLHGTQGKARNLFSELMKNMATLSKPDGGALPNVLERFINRVSSEAEESNTEQKSIFDKKLASIIDLASGYDFATVINAYWKGFNDDNEELVASAIRWLRGEFPTKTAAKHALKVGKIVDDTNIYDFLKLIAEFVKMCGYKGLLVGLDEMVNLYRLSNTRARNSNYEKILGMLNDCIQGSTSHIGFILSGTPDFLTDTRKGIFSNDALRSRLEENRFASASGVIDLRAPVIRLKNLSKEDLYMLLRNIREVFANGKPENYLVPDEALERFMVYCSEQIGDSYFRTPRKTVIEFVNLLSTLESDPDSSWENLLKEVSITADTEPDMTPIPDDEIGDEHELSGFKLDN